MKWTLILVLLFSVNLYGQNNFKYKINANGGASVTGNVTVTGRVEAQLVDHAFGGFEDSTVTITIAEDTIWYQITNASDSLFRWIQYNTGFAIDGDTMTYTGTDSVHIDFYGNFNVNATNAKDFELRVFNVTDNSGVLAKSKITTTGTNNWISVAIKAYDIAANTNDKYILQVRCVTDATNITFFDGIWRADVRHY